MRRGYLAYDETRDDYRPGVLVVPDWDGIGPYEEWRAKLLAQLGYVAFVADTYGSDIPQGPSMPLSQREQLFSYLVSNRADYRARMSAGLTQLRQARYVNGSQLGAIGYCLGGAGVIELARGWPNGTDGLLGVAAFHGVPYTSNGTKATAGNPIRIVEFLGANDVGFTPTDLEAFAAEMNAANVTWEVDLFGQAAHAFTAPNLAVSGGTINGLTVGVWNGEANMAQWSKQGALKD
ncbi:hypothetical protein WJX72_011005 [[Myrmecia] bisecta]|uniref:Dienelactone hydrolase domain-containing protein n=1 Tax=[Myrmecia] bisecta TaxID=41462 RepID=A0AAW1Q8A4_9CHLO